MRRSLILFVLAALLASSVINNRVEAQAVGDYGTISSGAWTTISIWRQWDGVGWNTVPASVPSNVPNLNVNIRSGHIVTVPGPGPYNIASLRVETGAKLYANISTTNVFLSIWGSNIVCDGEIGNGTLFDGLAFNIETAPGTNNTACTISGTGVFTASRIRKTSLQNPVSNLVIAMDVALRWSASSSTAIYNNVTTGPSRFNVTVNSGYTLNVAGSPTTPANLSVDGVGLFPHAPEAAGTYNVYGTIIVAGILYATTDNTTAGNNAFFNVYNGGVIKANQINSPSSGAAGTLFNVQSGGKLELTGVGFAVTNAATWGKLNNRYVFSPGSTVEYSSSGTQNVLHPFDFNTAAAPDHYYWNLTTSGSGNKILRAPVTTPMIVRGNLNITGASVLDQATANPDLHIGGNWNNYNQSGFNQSSDTTKMVRFYGNGISAGAVPTQTITCPGGEIFTNLWISKTTNASVKMMSPVTVNKQLKLGLEGTSNWGILDLNRNPLTLQNPAASAILVTGTGSYNRFIICEDTTGLARVRWNIGATATATPNIGQIIAGLQDFWPWPYMIPFGINTSSDTIPFGFYKPSTDNMGYLTVSTYGTPPDNQPWPSTPTPAVTNLDALNTANNNPDNREWTADRFWYIGADNPVAGCGAALLYNSGNVNPAASNTSEYPTQDNDPWNLLAQYWDASGSTWALPQVGTGVGPLPFIPFIIPSAVIVPTLPIWNTHWTLSSQSSPLYAQPLPVELISFDARNAGADVQVDWITASETDNRFFTVERSADGRTYFPIGTVEGAGTTSQQHVYGFTDHRPLDGISYYRLSQTDYDGKVTRHDPVSVDRSKAIRDLFILSPNPSNGYAVLETATGLREQLAVSITDISGRTVFSGMFDSGSQHVFPIDISAFSVGIYNVRITGISANSTFRLVKE